MPEKKNYLDRMLKMCSLESAVRTLFAWIKPILLYFLHPELLFDKFLYVMRITNCLHLKERDRNRYRVISSNHAIASCWS